MAEPFIGEIKMFAGNFAINGWALCNGALVSISQNEALFALIGTIYGGDGVTTFALPDLQSRIPIHQGQGPGLSNRVIGERSGTENVTLITANMPAHQHAFTASQATGSLPGPSGGLLAVPGGNLGTPTLYVVPGTSTVVSAAMAATSIAATGGNQPHNNVMPVLAYTFQIALFGVFPSRN